MEDKIEVDGDFVSDAAWNNVLLAAIYTGAFVHAELGRVDPEKDVGLIGIFMFGFLASLSAVRAFSQFRLLKEQS